MVYCYISFDFFYVFFLLSLSGVFYMLKIKAFASCILTSYRMSLPICFNFVMFPGACVVLSILYEGILRSLPCSLSCHTFRFLFFLYGIYIAFFTVFHPFRMEIPCKHIKQSNVLRTKQNAHQNQLTLGCCWIFFLSALAVYITQ